MSYDSEVWCKIWRQTDFLFHKWQEFGEFSPEHSKVWKICTLIGSYCAKYLMFDLKKYWGVIFHDTEEWCKIWKKTDLWFGKWHEEFGKFSPEHWKVSKLGLWWDPFVQSRKYMNLKFKEELCVMTMKNHTKMKNSWLVVLKLTWGIWQILTRALENLKHLLLNWLLWPKYINFRLKNVQRSYL